MTNHPKRRTSGLGLTEAEAAAARDILAATSAYIASVTQSMARQIKEAGGKLPSRFVIPPPADDFQHQQVLGFIEKYVQQRLDQAPADTEIQVEIVFASELHSHPLRRGEYQ
jgi:hypothetical protein